MKPIYVGLFVLIVGVCCGDDSKVSSKDNTPSTSTAPVSSHNEKVVVNPSTDPKNATREEKHEPSSAPMPSTSSSPKTTTTTQAPSTTPKPEYGVGSWNVTDANGHVCILLKGEIKLTLRNELNSTEIVNFEVAKNVPNGGNCVDGCIMFTLPNNSSLHLMFARNNDSSFFIRAIKANLSYTTENKTAPHEFANHTLHLFETPLGHSYYCAREAENVIAHEPALTLIMKVSDFQVQAFMNSTSADFGAAIDCESPHTPDIVPIVVGCALALLVIVVLVAYLVGRMRSQSRGYHSM